MIDWGRLLLGSLYLRPYVFAFVAVHLASSSALLGSRRTVGFTLITWAVAYAAEFSSIRTGIPFGWYYYIPHTADRELWIGGVPFFDSISFSFLLVSSYGLAWLLLSRTTGWSRPPALRHGVLATALFVMADVIIDPVALRGDRWFLGQIYGYPIPGIYFGVPLANFVGWGVVGAVATALYQAWERRLPPLRRVRFAGRALLCPGLYFLVLAFNLTITFAIAEWGLGLVGLLMAVPLFARSAAAWQKGMGIPQFREGNV
ncbi:MAG TPA: carotenoid biosynthesis protein [Candidatus Baltobacteraceae bacterium]|nr:carotenoid biosynthesis protein [Candidatus Baltobacteraceae bacterium]